VLAHLCGLRHDEAYSVDAHGRVHDVFSVRHMTQSEPVPKFVRQERSAEIYEADDAAIRVSPILVARGGDRTNPADSFEVDLKRVNDEDVDRVVVRPPKAAPELFRIAFAVDAVKSVRVGLSNFVVSRQPDCYVDGREKLARALDRAVNMPVDVTKVLQAHADYVDVERVAPEQFSVSGQGNLTTFEAWDAGAQAEQVVHDAEIALDIDSGTLSHGAK
jgi:hypothetical protein